MAEDFDLALSTVAHYRWGSLAISFDWTPIRDRALFDALRREQDLDYTIEDSREAREIVSYLHEIVHYAQDLDTGVGHWDDHLRRRWLPECLVNLRGPGSHPSPTLPFPQTYADDDLAGDVSYARTIHEAFVRDQQLFRGRRSMPAARAEAIAEIVNQDLGTSHAADAMVSLWPEALFEGEAAATVQSLLMKGRINTARREALDDASDLWDFFKQPETYQASFRLFVSAFDGIPDDPQWRADTVFDWFCTLMDIACAYPSPGWFERHRDVERAHFEPGVKFLRLARALADNGRAVEQAVDDDDPEAAERILLDAMPLRYPSAREVYAGWAEWFDQAIRNGSGGGPVLTLRRDNARRRATVAPIMPVKTPMQLTMAELPLLMFDKQGPHQTWHREMLANPQLQGALVADSLYDAALAELVGAMLESGRMRCPLGVTRFCKSVQPGCSAIRDLRNLPQVQGCHVRSMLEVNGYRIAPPGRTDTTT